MFSDLVRFSLLEKYPTFGREQPEDAVSHIRRIRRLAPKKSESSARNVLEIAVMEAPIAR